MPASQARNSFREIGRAVLAVVTLAACFGGALTLIFQAFPALQEGDKATLKRFPPPSLAHLKQQRDVLLVYADVNPGCVLLGVCLVYISMQTFAIPGTLSLSILCGALYGVPKGLFLVSVVSTAGSTCSYLLSRAVGRGAARAIWPERIDAFGREIDRRRSDMLRYIVFLRVTPILPNTFINIASPVVRVPLGPYVAGTYIGCMPNNFIAVNAGNKLSTLRSLSDLYDTRQLLLGVLIGAVAILPIYWRRHADTAKTRN